MILRDCEPCVANAVICGRVEWAGREARSGSQGMIAEYFLGGNMSTDDL
jgi:hypothetical protein